MRSGGEELLAGLNDRQRDAVTAIEGPVLIIAGAGSGKTRVLTHRIAYMIANGIPAYSILALTFTNKAAREMKERITKISDDADGEMVWAGTFHSIFARLLRRYGDRLGYGKDFTIYDTDDSMSAIKAVHDQLNISRQTINPSLSRAVISQCKNDNVSWSAFASQARSQNDRLLAGVYELYDKRLRMANAMDFDDILVNMGTLLEHHPEVRSELQQRFQYISVDEFQDTNRIQYFAVRHLAAAHRCLCVVGDDAQSIYKWRGADIRNILDFEKDYPEARVVRLEQNYRSTKTILAAADNVIRNNRGQLKKNLWTENLEGSKIELLDCANEREEARRIVDTLKLRIAKDGHDFRDVAILYRTNAQSQPIEDALRMSRIPYYIVSGVSFYKRKEVRDVVAYLRLLVNPADAESLLRIINEPPRGIGQTSMGRIQQFAVDRDIPLYMALQQVNDVGVTSRTTHAVRSFVNLVDGYRNRLSDMLPPELAREYIESTGLMNALDKSSKQDAEERKRNIERLLTHMYEAFEADPSLTLQDYLEQVALVGETDELQTGTNRVALMTVHAAKGLEYPLVFIAGMEAGLFPLQRNDTTPEDLEEERRLFYVAITRACKDLVMSMARTRPRYGELMYGRPSPFLGEIDESLFQGMPRAVRAAASPDGVPPFKETFSQVQSSLPGISAGQSVRHKIFGYGTVLAVSGYGVDMRATVMFQTAGKKNLVLRYAGLEVV